jgi:ABC-type phosphate transport system auxiliary subunit
MTIIGYGSSQEVNGDSEKENLSKQEKEIEDLMKKMQEFENLDASSIGNSDMNTHSSSRME